MNIRGIIRKRADGTGYEWQLVTEWHGCEPSLERALIVASEVANAARMGIRYRPLVFIGWMLAIMWLVTCVAERLHAPH